MRLAAVKTAFNLLLQPVGVRRVLRLDHPLGELAQFFRAELAVFVSVPGELNNAAAFIAREPFYFFDYFNRGHALRLVARTLMSKRETMDTALNVRSSVNGLCSVVPLNSKADSGGWLAVE
jgi:hypothetical protein